MKKSLYLLTHGILSQQDNTLLYTNQAVKTALPITQIQDIHALGKISLKSGAIRLLAKHNVPVHFYNQYQTHIGSFTPRTNNTNGTIIVAQTKAYLNKEKRVHIAKAIVEATKHNILYTLKRYTEKNTPKIMNAMKTITGTTIPNTTIPEIMAQEAQIWKTYYTTFQEITPSLPLERRTFHPPHNEMNALISLLHVMTYTTTLTQILQTYLHPAISYLHEPLERRYSLALDLAEPFKPIIAHRVIFRLVNRKQITKDSFTREKGIQLTEEAMKKVINEFQAQLDTTITHRKLKRKITYRSLIKTDAYRLVKYVLGDTKTFKPYKTKAT